MKVDGIEVDYSGLPERYRETMRRYVANGLDPGTGWQLILSNCLSAVVYCDAETARDLPQIWRWIYGHAPSQCHGSAQIVADWMRARRQAA